MLFSVFISFLLGRRLRGRVYVLSVAAVLVLVSLMSMGFPSVWGTLEWHRLAAEHVEGGTTVWQLNTPAVPLSFPFQASVSEEYHIILFVVDYPSPPLYQVELSFLTSHLWANYRFHWVLTSEHVTLLALSFFIFNLVGAMLGHWISKTTLVDELLKSLLLGLGSNY